MRWSTLVAGLIVTAAPLSAQMEFAIKGGGSFGDISNKQFLSVNLKTRTGFAAGFGVVSAGLAGVGVEALFAQRGLRNTTPLDEFKLNYVDVPVYLRLMLPTSHSLAYQTWL